jgi:peptide subunit release factor 1 (eRF1)
VPTANRSSSKRQNQTTKARRGATGGGARRPGEDGAVAALIDRMTGIGVTPHLVVSCYLKLEPRDRSRGKYLIKLKNRAKRLLGSLGDRGLSRQERAQVEADVERIREHLSHPSALPAGRGIAVFACGPLGLFEAVPLPLVFRSRLVVDRSPLVRELAALDSEFGRLLCAVYDRTSARFFEVSAGGVTELAGLTAGDTARTARFHGQSTARPDRGGGNRGAPIGPRAPGEHNFNQRIREEKQRHYATVAQRLFDLTRERSFRGIVLAGAKADTGAVAGHLHPYVADALIGATRLNAKAATEADVLNAVLDLRTETEREWERRHLHALEEGLGTGWALNGVAATLAALGRGQVRTLLVDATAERPGFRCRSDGRLAVVAEECEGDADPVLDVVDEAIEEALRQGAQVDVVEDSAVRARVDGLAGLLRFRVG